MTNLERGLLLDSIGSNIEMLCVDDVILATIDSEDKCIKMVSKGDIYLQDAAFKTLYTALKTFVSHNADICKSTKPSFVATEYGLVKIFIDEELKFNVTVNDTVIINA